PWARGCLPGRLRRRHRSQWFINRPMWWRVPTMSTSGGKIPVNSGEQAARVVDESRVDAAPGDTARADGARGDRARGDRARGDRGRGEEMSALLGPVRTGNAFEETVERLLAEIKLGLVAPGERFPAERELAARLGISRLTLREAIRELQQAGFVESRRGR